MDYLKELAIRILQEVPNGLSKVKFAKIIYFTHKYLVIKHIKAVHDLAFIRMPLGPVPVGFMDLEGDGISIALQPSALSFDKQTYSWGGQSSYSDKEQEYINKVVQSLNAIPTNELVEASHLEPSWLSHANGVEYYIDTQDLSQPLPKTKSILQDEKLAEQHLQAKLVEGMLDDIVDESTLLEYPKTKSN